MDTPQGRFDLSRLASVRGAEAFGSAPPPSRRRRFDWRTWAPLLLVAAGALVLAAVYLLPLVEPVHTVRLAPVVARQDVAARRTTTALQASGWAEPDPFPMRINPQVPGVIRELPVLEGTPLVAGETVVAQLDTTLVDREIATVEAQLAATHAKIAAKRTEIEQTAALAERNLTARLRVAELARSRADLRRQQREAETELASAQAVRRQNAEARTALAMRQREVAAAQAALAEVNQQASALEARLPWLRARAEALRETVARSGATELEAQDAETAYAEAQARLAGFTRRREALRATLNAAQHGYEVAAELVEAPAGLEAAVANAQATVDGLAGQLAAVEALLAIAQDEAADALTLRAQVAVLQAQLRTLQAEATEAEAQLALLQERQALHTVVSPVDGEVLAVMVTPGAMFGSLSEAMAIVTAFDPQRIQVRVDLPLADVASVEVGQRVEIVSEAVPGHTYEGVVTRFVRQANLARNSLQVKVKVLEPDGRLKPDMLTRCRFLPMPRRDPSLDGQDAAPIVVRRFVPRSAVVPTDGEASVFVYDPRGHLHGEGRAYRVGVTVFEDTDAPEGYVEVDGALQLSHHVIDVPPAGLRQGARVRPQ